MELVWCSVCHLRHSHALARIHLDNDPLGPLYTGKIKAWQTDRLHDYERECRKEAQNERLG
jgi:hypothetical protein